MTRLPLLLATAALGCLAACSKPAGEAAGSAETTTAAPAGPVAVAVGDAVQPGYWQTTTLSTGEEPDVDHDCITPEEANLKDQLRKSLKTENCTYARQQVGGGRFDIEGTCAAQGDGVVGESRMKMTGTYGPTSYNMDLAIGMTVQGKPMNMAWKVTGKRVGDTCPADDAE